MTIIGQSAGARYQALEPARRPFLDRAREAAKLTAPALAPPEGHGGGSGLPTPYQGVGARGVNSLANKLLLAQFPPGAPFFRLVVDADALRAGAPTRLASQQASPPQSRGGAAAVEAALARLEKSVTLDFETGFLRAGLHAALRQLIVAGNCLLHLSPDGGVRVFRLDRYVVKRDALGAVSEIVVKEGVAPDALPEGIAQSGGGGAPGLDARVDLFTWIRRERDHWSVVQEALGQEIPGSAGRYPLEHLDWLALRWSHVDGEDYGRGHVEEYLGDLRSLEGLMQAIVEGAAAASRMTVLVAPNGQTDAEELAEAENGAIIDGVASDVAFLQAGKHGDFRIALETVKMLTERLSFAFLTGEAVKLDRERVTAEEIRFMAAELENALGGVYSVLAEELQKPLVSLLLHHKARQGTLPPLPPGLVRPEIVTGLDALGRGRELQRLEAFLSFVAQIGELSATPLGRGLDLSGILSHGGAALGVDMERFMSPDAARLQTSPPGSQPGAASGSNLFSNAEPGPGPDFSMAPAAAQPEIQALIQRLGPVLERFGAGRGDAGGRA